MKKKLLNLVMLLCISMSVSAHDFAVANSINEYTNPKYQEVNNLEQRIRNYFDTIKPNPKFKPQPIGLDWMENSHGANGKWSPGLTAEDIQNYNAVDQSAASKLFNGFVKMLTTAGTTVIISTLGILWGVGQGILNTIDDNKNTTFIGGMVDNAIINTMVQWRKKMEKIRPNYYTTDELENPWYKNLGTANFWGDKFLKNIGYPLGLFLVSLMIIAIIDLIRG